MQHGPFRFRRHPGFPLPVPNWQSTPTLPGCRERRSLPGVWGPRPHKTRGVGALSPWPGNRITFSGRSGGGVDKGAAGP